MYQNKKISAIINCAGSGTRFGSNKLIQKISDEDLVITRSVKNFVLPIIDEILVTTNEQNRELYQKILIEEHQLPVKLIIGGSERYLSALNGLKAATGEIVLLHDGVRPFVSPDMIERLLEVAIENRAAMLAVPATTTIKVIDPENQLIKQSLKRQESWLAQTPQAFERELLLRVYQQALAEDYQIVSDDSELLTAFTQLPVKVVLGDETNLKITFPLDLEVARLIERDKKIANVT